MRKKRVAILGSTGSIGRNTLKVIERLSGRFEVAALTAYNSLEALLSQAERFRPAFIGLKKADFLSFRSRLSYKARLYDVDSEVGELVSRRDIDIVVIAVTGAAALDPFLAAACSGKTIAPANKEALVMAGDLIMAQARKNGARIIPVDSEQSAIFQCLDGRGGREGLKAVHLTASGGALRDIPPGRHDRFSMKQILRHPRWRMGAKITVDSASLMNKGFEVIEAMRLFGLSAEQVKVLVHPEAIIHSMVEFHDGSFLAQLGVTDMRLPIQYALTYPERVPTALKALDLAALGALTFRKPDLKGFPSLGLALYVARQGGSLPAVLNAADEVAVDAFLRQRILFTDIYKLVERVVLKHDMIKGPSLGDIREADAWARRKAIQSLEKMR
jgi:1-deoxy-D-xylulose-5-phosphate reductoisomerase